MYTDTVSMSILRLHAPIHIPCKSLRTPPSHGAGCGPSCRHHRGGQVKGCLVDNSFDMTLHHISDRSVVFACLTMVLSLQDPNKDFLDQRAKDRAWTHHGFCCTLSWWSRSGGPSPSQRIGWICEAATKPKERCSQQGHCPAWLDVRIVWGCWFSGEFRIFEMSEGANKAKLAQGFSMQQYSVYMYVHTLFAGIKNPFMLVPDGLQVCRSPGPGWFGIACSGASFSEKHEESLLPYIISKHHRN